jgi:hypothetical protein
MAVIADFTGVARPAGWIETLLVMHSKSRQEKTDHI